MKLTRFFSFAMALLISFSLSAKPAKKKAPAPLGPETQVQYISGHDAASAVEWDFFCTEGRNSGEWTKIKVPSCWETEGFGTYQYGMPFYGKARPAGIATEQGIYKTSFKLPAEWEGRVIRLVFEGVMTDCTVNINGRRGIKLHQGSFYRFYGDMSDRIYFGNKENTLEITVSKESANESVNLAERRADYWNFGGIFRPVYIEALPAFHIDRLALDAKADGDFRSEIFLGCAMDENYSIETSFTDIKGKKVGKAFSTPVRNGSDKVIIETQVPGVKNWTAETPNLYYVEFSLLYKGEVQHKVRQRFGFRTIEVRENDGLYINGERILVKGVNRHSFRPETGRALSYADNLADVKIIKEMNMNAVRMSHYPPDAIFLDYCDSLGLYVMNELAGWHGKYDTEVGSKLVKEMITRDVNHPSIIWWSNGNEGGFNYELEPYFHEYDPQKRPVLYPWANRNGFETKHYRSYGESQDFMRNPGIFMPTEFLHGLYDGGHGAGLWDMWEMQCRHPRNGGGFLWVFADEGVMRSDMNGKIDNVGNYGADGIVGPHHEKEGSFYTIRQVWSPIYLKPANQPQIRLHREEKMRADQCSYIADADAFAGKFIVENRYDFNNLKDCSFSWELANYSLDKAGHEVIAKGQQQGFDLPARQNGELALKLPANWKDADALYVTAYNPAGESVYTWAWYWKSVEELQPETKAQDLALSYEYQGDDLLVKAGDNKLVFNTKNGYLKSFNQFALSNGPRFIAARRGDRSQDVYYNHDDKTARSKERIYQDISGTSTLTKFEVKEEADKLIVSATYWGQLQQVDWTIEKSGAIYIDYAYRWEGNIELCGICFDYPEEKMQSVRFLGKGPYRVWQNRMHGTVLDVWENEYNDPIPGESFTYPEFKGYFNDWKWAQFQTEEGQLLLQNHKAGTFLGVYTPRDGRDVLLYTLPQTGIAVFDVIPGVRNKVNSTDLVGPSSLPQWLEGVQKGRIQLSGK